jgi:hypothetical protein
VTGGSDMEGRVPARWADRERAYHRLRDAGPHVRVRTSSQASPRGQGRTRQRLTATGVVALVTLVMTWSFVIGYYLGRADGGEEGPDASPGQALAYMVASI